MTADRRQARHVVVMGLMGSGKTSVGVRLAKALGWPFRDSDADLEARYGLTARELAERDGIRALHRLERQHLLEALADPQPSVIAAAASTIDDAACRAALRQPDVRTVWLDGTPAVLASRQRPGDHRPEFGPNLEEIIRKQRERRLAAFTSVADDIIDAGQTRPKQIVARLLR